MVKIKSLKRNISVKQKHLKLTIVSIAALKAV